MTIEWSLYENKLEIQGDSFKERQFNNTANLILRNFESSPSCQDVYINGSLTATKMAILEDGSISDTVNNVKTFVMKPSASVSVGDVISWNSVNWLVTKSEMFGNIYQRGNIEKSTTTLSYYSNENSILYTIPCIIKSGVSFNTNDTTIISTATNEITVTVPNTTITQGIKADEIYKLGMYSYKVSTVPDDISNPGLIILRMVYSEVAQVIPDGDDPITATYVISGDSEIKVGSTSIYSAHKYNNGVEVTGVAFVFSVVPGDTPDAAYEYTSLGSNQCQIKCNQYSYYITLRAIDTVSDEYVEKQIKLRSIL